MDGHPILHFVSVVIIEEDLIIYWGIFTQSWSFFANVDIVRVYEPKLRVLLVVCVVEVKYLLANNVVISIDFDYYTIILA